MLLVEKEGFELPVVVAPAKDGCILRVENGQQHIDQGPVQEALAEVASLIAERTGGRVLRATVSRKVLRRYGLFNP